MKLVVEDIQKWWNRVGIKLKHKDTIMQMVKTLQKRYSRLKQNWKRENTGINKVKREKFINDLANTLWVVCDKEEKRLENSTNEKCINDWKYLQKVKGTRREATLGCIDKQEMKKIGVREQGKRIKIGKL